MNSALESKTADLAKNYCLGRESVAELQVEQIQGLVARGFDSLGCGPIDL